MRFEEVVTALKTTYSRRIFESYGYDNTRKKYTALETFSHNNADIHPSMGLHQFGGSFFLKDFAGERKKYSSIDLVMISEGLEFADAVRKGAEICGISIDDSKSEELPPDIRFVVSGLYAKAKSEGFSVKEIRSKHHYHYEDADGKKLYDKYRIDFISGDGEKRKYFHQGIEQNGFVRKFKQNEYQSLIAMYGDFRQYQAGEKVYITEGEECVKSCHAKRMQNVVTAGSSNDWKSKGKKFAVFFKDIDVVILQDNDESGEDLTRDIISSLNGVAASIKVVVPDRSRNKADIADFFSNGGTLQQLEEMERKTVPVQKQTQIPGECSSNFNIGQDTEFDYTPFHFYNNNGKITGINHNAIAEDIKAKHSLFVSCYFYESENGYYRPDMTGAKIKGYIRQRIMPDLRKSQVINQIYNLLHDDFSIERNFNDTNLYPARWVPFNDCLLDPLTWEEIAYKDGFYCVNRLPHNWKDCKNAMNGEETEKYLHFAFPDGQDREMALSYDGLSCNRDTSFQKAMLYVGEGGSGKSVKLKILQAILGTENYSNVGLFDLGKRFMPGLLLGKLANICADLPLKALSDEASEALKLIVGEDTIFHETKGQNGFFFTPYCKMTFSMNMLPQVLDERNNAVFRRFLIIRMDNLPKNPDVTLLSKLEKELPYYIKLTMEALHRVYERGYILESENSKNEIEQMKRDSDTTADFLDMCCTIEPGARVDRGELFTRYEKHCESEGRQALSKNAFNKAIRSKGYKQVKSCGYWYFEGISLEKPALNSSLTSKQYSLNDVEVDANGFIKVDDKASKELPFT